ncbi:HIT domain-containing protein [Lentisphaerota bacterium WC36G]|nr:HIT domain-containing protein [Lentisphaerae bacterium WC36]
MTIFKNEDRPIWAPWRIDFIRGEKDDQCFLCNKKKSKYDCFDEELVIYREELVFVILNRYPYNPGHMLVSPYRHVGDLTQLSDEEHLAVMKVTAKMQELLECVMQPEGFNIGLNTGKSAGAGVEDHLHMHIVPRWNGDNNFMPVLGGNRVVPEALNATAQLLREELKKMA